MKLAKGSKSWILFCFFLGMFFLVLYLLFYGFETGIVFLFLMFLMFLFMCFLLVFFRDPERKTGKGLVAVADGRIREIIDFNDKVVGGCVRVSTFMNVYNVHVNRMPIDGQVLDLVHHSGFHLPAFRKESENNERVVLIVDTKIGKMKIVLIAGTLARRIVTYVSVGDNLKKGDRIGIIRLGSRVDLYIPSKHVKKTVVKVRDMVKAGEDTVAKINA
jgi:phosphatidylserine decarboxylase